MVWKNAEHSGLFVILFIYYYNFLMLTFVVGKHGEYL